MLDLGSGGGIDVILSAKRVGPTGTLHGLDMTDEMLALAQENARDARVANAHFLKGVIEQIPLPATGRRGHLQLRDQPVGRQAGRADRNRAGAQAGGRIGISDVVAEDHLTPDERAGAWLLCGLHRRGALEGRVRGGARVAGFEQVSVEFTHRVADGMHGAIVKAVKAIQPERKTLPVIEQIRWFADR